MFKPSWKSFAKWSLTAAAVVFGFGAASSTAQAQFGGGFGYGAGYGPGFSPYGGIGPNYGGAVFVGPPAYRFYRPPIYRIQPFPGRTHWHWSPSRGWHLHGNGGIVPPIYR